MSPAPPQKPMSELTQIPTSSNLSESIFTGQIGTLVVALDQQHPPVTEGQDSLFQAAKTKIDLT